MRVAVVDIGTNSTRLLIADVTAAGAVTELERRTTVTRLGQDVDTSGLLAPAATERVFAALTAYREVIDAHAVEATTGVLTSAVRDARNGAEFTAAVRDRFGIDARTITGEEEAQLTFRGATSERPHDGRQVMVIDIGGGSTELVAGVDGHVTFHVSTQAGVVRQSERFLRDDPPAHAELELLAAEAQDIFEAAAPPELRGTIDEAVAVAGTATSLAAIAQELDPYDATKVHGYRLLRAEVEMLLARLAGLTEAERREVPGLHPDRARTIVAGAVLLQEVLRAFGLDAVTVSEHDILRGAALQLAGRPPPG
jgi:exopolyphosphatase/guanosine-5'-triphosphate,3'-diphosphate pyrophosphatase